jgi:predicted nucleotide-binding protein (sugar kinase/HSP70/actin superfamily)
MKIGIPRGLLVYYKQFVFWKNFFEGLGKEVIISEVTNKKILKDGIRLAVEESCLPLKLFYGHVYNLINNKEKKIDFIFIPRIVSLLEKTYHCPKFIGLPDMIIHAIPNIDKKKILQITIDFNREPFYVSAYKLGFKLCKNPILLIRAYKQAKEKAKKDYFLKVNHNKSYHKKILVLGHPYNIYEPFVNADILNYLQNKGILPITVEMLPDSILNKEINIPMYWSFSKEFINALYYAIESKDIKGMINIVSFGCGPDSLLSEIILREAKKHNLPTLQLILDEHTCDVGIITRLEAFLELL